MGTVPGSSRRAWSGRKPTSSVESLLWERELEFIGEGLDKFWAKGWLAIAKQKPLSLFIPLI